MKDLMLLDSEFTEEEIIIRDSTRKFVQEKIYPKINDSFEKALFPKEFITYLAQMGLFGITLPEQYNGSNLSNISYGLVCQELEKVDSGLRSFVSVQNSLCIYPIFNFGTEEQKQKFLPQMATGKILGCFGLTEPNSGSDPVSMKTTAKKTKNGWILNGSKMWITNATIADLAIVWAKIEDGTVRGFIVEKNFKGFNTKEIKKKLSLRASVTGEISLQDCFVPDENLLIKTDIGISAALKCLTQARYGIAWGAIGAAIDCYEKSLSYSKERKQFNKPIAACQLIQKTLVDMYSEIIKAQILNLHLGKLKEKNKLNYAAVSLAKRNSCKVALDIARNARNILGANGISLEYDIIRHMNNLESVFTYEGTDNVHTLILGRYLTEENAF